MKKYLAILAIIIAIVWCIFAYSEILKDRNYPHGPLGELTEDLQKDADKCHENGLEAHKHISFKGRAEITCREKK